MRRYHPRYMSFKYEMLLTTARTQRLFGRRVAPVGPLVAVPVGIEDVLPPLTLVADVVVETVETVDAVVEVEVAVVVAVP